VTAALAEQMKEAMTNRAVIEQAKGIIMRDRGCSSDEAFDVLVRLSQRRMSSCVKSPTTRGRRHEALATAAGASVIRCAGTSTVVVNNGRPAAISSAIRAGSTGREKR